MRDWYEEIVMAIIAFVLIIVVALGIIAVGSYLLDRPACFARTENIGFERDWSFWGGCVIEVEKGKWIPLNNYYYEQE